MTARALGLGFFVPDVKEVLRCPFPRELMVVALALRRAGLKHSAIRQILTFSREDIFAGVFESDEQSDYAAVAFSRLLDTESRFLPRPAFMDEQENINSTMRGILVDRLVEVHQNSRLAEETLFFLTVSIIDRYLTARQVATRRLPCLGVTALYIAAKYEETDPPPLSWFSHIAYRIYSNRDITSMECSILAALDFQIAVPTPVHFFDRLQRANLCTPVHRNFAQYAVELSLLDDRYSEHPPSLLVSAALLMSNEFLGRRRPQLWSAAMVHYSCYSEASLSECAASLRVTRDNAASGRLQAVRRKYLCPSYGVVANLSPYTPPAE